MVDSEFAASDPSATIDGIWAKNKAGSNVVVEDSYIHELSWFASDPNQGGGATHNDGVQSFDGDSNVTLRRNNIDLSTSKQANAAWQNLAVAASSTSPIVTTSR